MKTQNVLKIVSFIIVVIMLLIFVLYGIDNNIKENNIKLIRNGAVKDYYKETGEFPTCLEQLIPKYLKRVPRNKGFYEECRLQLYFQIGDIFVDGIIQYKKDKGEYPRSLENLVPNYIKEHSESDSMWVGSKFGYFIDSNKFYLDFEAYDYSYTNEKQRGWVYKE